MTCCTASLVLDCSLESCYSFFCTMLRVGLTGTDMKSAVTSYDVIIPLVLVDVPNLFYEVLCVLYVLLLTDQCLKNTS